jgi:Transposase
VLYAGNDWSEDHHDVGLVDEAGRRLARAGLAEGVSGIARLHELAAAHLGESDGPERVVAGIETGRGPWVAALVAAGYRVYAINPGSVARYRERHSTSGAKAMPGMRGCWLTWSAPMLPGIARSPGVARPRRGSRCWPGRACG